MKKVYFNNFPPAGNKAMVIWPLLFIRKRAASFFSPTDERHEMIHGAQQKEMLLIFFFLWYGMEWVVRLIQYRNATTAYKNISFEREAYDNQDKTDYLDKRSHYTWAKY